MYKTIGDYPTVLTAADISEILRVSKPTAYELMDRESFPLIKIGRSKRVLKDDFIQWLLNKPKVIY
ncbi:DNA binding domain, excisionase family [Mycobacteroides abscessus subsp. abscessus]|nr:DNA binding domain, excisionase family [Mycobacteroides abscessus subsp. abscessus]